MGGNKIAETGDARDTPRLGTWVSLNQAIRYQMIRTEIF